MEELVGEIWDEHDEKVSVMTKLDEDVYEFSAQFHIDDFAKVLNIPEPETSYYNLGGLSWNNYQVSRKQVIISFMKILN